MDAGCYAKALQYASEARIKIIGKPCKSFFEQGLRELNMKKEEVFFKNINFIILLYSLHRLFT